MSRFSPLDFQNTAIDKLTQQFVKLWGNQGKQIPLVFKSPTGSGKTLMVANFINQLNHLPQWEVDKAFIWVTFSDDLAMQSKDKFGAYFSSNLQNNLLTINDFKQGKLESNDILFINWQKLVSKAAKNRVVRRPTDENLQKELGYYFEDVIENTTKEGRELIMIVDESHTHLSALAKEKVVDVVDPKIIIYVSATPKNIPNIEDVEDGISGYVSVKREDVVKEGLIKEHIVTQTEEDLKQFKGQDLDEALIDLAILKKKKLEQEYAKLKKDINPLVLIQLPNDDNRLKGTNQKTKEEVVLEHLKSKGIDIDMKVALWFDGKQKRLEFVTHNESEVDYLLFKQAAGTGWDCPRAHILVMYREITSEEFHTQTLGRILRMPEPNKREDYKNTPSLRVGYLYTNYKRNEVKVPDQSSKNKPLLYTAKRREGVSNIKGINSDYISRVEFGDLGNSFEFQNSFQKSLNDYFNISENDLLETTKAKIAEKGVQLNSYLTNNIIVDEKFTDFDKLKIDFNKSGKELEYEISRNDVERLFNYYCYKVLAEQTEYDAKVSNISRSWSPLKSAIRIWFRNNLDQNSDYFYRVFIKDLISGQSSIFRPAITQALKDYRPILNKLISDRKKEDEWKEAPSFSILPEYSFSEDYSIVDREEVTTNLSVIQPFYLKKQYSGRANEILFIAFIEQQEELIEWWFKNGDNGKDYFSAKYFNKAEGKESLFYPDWIIKFKSGHIGFFDTKAGITAMHTDGRSRGLAEKIESINLEGQKCFGGIVLLENYQWYINQSKEYSYIPRKLDLNWKPLGVIFKQINETVYNKCNL